jgi:hypothetical protein
VIVLPVSTLNNVPVLKVILHWLLCFTVSLIMQTEMKCRHIVTSATNAGVRKVKKGKAVPGTGRGGL